MIIINYKVIALFINSKQFTIFMKLKQIPEDFIVDEIFDLNLFKEKNEGKKQDYYYFKLTKNNYNQLRALALVAQDFNTSSKLIHIAGTKDKAGITSQIISVYGIKDENFEKNLEHFNSSFKDLKLEFIGKFNGRLNLGDNLGNKFNIIIRDLTLEDSKLLKKNFKLIEKKGILNYFDDQRFGYAQNSHIIGRYILKNEIEKAVYEIFTSLPDSPTESLKLYIDFLKENFEKIKLQDKEVYEKAIEIMPKFLSEQKDMLAHLIKYRNDFSGSFRKLHKKLRTLYINAYQSYIFNETLKELKKRDLIDKYEELSLIDSILEFDDIIKPIVKEILDKDEVTIDNLKLPSMPELKIFSVKRKTKIYPKNLKLLKEENDELNENKFKIKISFDLGSGEYATNVVKQLFEK